MKRHLFMFALVFSYSFASFACYVDQPDWIFDSEITFRVEDEKSVVWPEDAVLLKLVKEGDGLFLLRKTINVLQADLSLKPFTLNVENGLTCEYVNLDNPPIPFRILDEFRCYKDLRAFEGPLTEFQFIPGNEESLTYRVVKIEIDPFVTPKKGTIRKTPVASNMALLSHN